MKQKITLQIGNGGINVSDTCWELFALQHEITLDGIKNQHNQNETGFTSFFTEIETNKYQARTACFDFDAQTIDSIKLGRNKQLYNHSQLLSLQGDASKNYAKGYYSLGGLLLEQSMDCIRKMIQNCQSFEGFMIYCAVGGGCGSGFNSLLLQNIQNEYHKPTVGFNIFSSLQNEPISAAINSVLLTHAFLQHQTLSMVIQNSSLSKICSKNIGIIEPSMTDINQAIATAVSAITASMRFDGYLNESLNQLCSKLLVNPRFKFIIPSFSPYVTASKPHLKDINLNEITEMAFDPANMLCECDPTHGKYMSLSVTFRGQCIPKYVNIALYKVKYIQKRISILQGHFNSYQVGINYTNRMISLSQKMLAVDQSCVLLANNTSVADVFSRINYQFDQLIKKKQIVELYRQEGMEIEQLKEAREDLWQLQMEYEKISQQEEKL